MAIVNTESLSFANMSSAFVRQYRGASLYATENWWLGYANSNYNCNICIEFTPDKPLSKAVFELTASSYTQRGDKPCYYYLNTESKHPTVPSINSNGTSFTFSDKFAAITLNDLEAGTTYYLWVSATSGDGNFAAFIPTAGFVCVSTVASYIVSYDANGGTNAPAAQTKDYDVALILTDAKPAKDSDISATYTVTFDANGGVSSKSFEEANGYFVYAFIEWNTEATGGGTAYAAGGSYTDNASVTLYAQYSSTTTTESVTLPTIAQCERPGYKLLGWAVADVGAAAIYAPGAAYTPDASITLYAVWEAQGLVYIDIGTGFEPRQVFVDAGSGWDQYAPYAEDGSTWHMLS